MNSEILLEAIGEMDLRLVRAARPPRRRRRSGRPLWPALPAAALATVLLLALAGSPERGFTTEAVEDFSSIAGSWDGTLLAENLLAAGAELTDIRLEHREDTDPADASGWRSLTFTARRDGDTVDVTCTFGVPEGLRLPGEPTETAEYGGVTVWLYIGSSGEGGGTAWTCRAVFADGGVAYDMTFPLAGPEDRETVYRNLDMILDGGPRPLGDLMGFTDYRVTAETGDSGYSTWHFWLTVGGAETCVAEVRGPEGELSVYGADLDGDGRDEAVANSVSADGTETVAVYRYDGESFWVGKADERSLDGAGLAEGAPDRPLSTRYDPETGLFTAEYTPEGADTPVSVTFSGPEHLIFRRFRSDGRNHFAPRPLSREELEHADARPVETVLGTEDYRVGVERTAERDVWHFFAGAVCLAEASARPGETPEVFSADVNSDGTPELVSNEPDGRVKVCGFVGPGLRINVLTLRQQVLDAAYSYAHSGGRVVTRFDPETGLFTVTAEDPEGETVYTDSFAFDTERFDCVPYCPRLWDEPEWVSLAPSSPAPAEGLPDTPACQGDDIRAETAGDALRQVLSGEREFLDTLPSGQVSGPLDMGSVGEALTDGGGELFRASEFTLADMDGDGVMEAAVRVVNRASEAEMGCLVLRYCAGQVYGYLYNARSFEDLKSDGTYRADDGASDHGYYRVTFDGMRLDEHMLLGVSREGGQESASEHWVYYYASSGEEFNRKEAEQEAKPDAEWLELTAENIAAAFG